MNHRLPRWITWLALGTLAFLYVPMLAVAVASVNRGRHGFTWRGFTFAWYTRLFGNEHVLEAARNTLVLAAISTLIATVLGTALAIGMSRFPWPRWVRRYLDLAVYLPVVTPDIIFAAALVVAFSVLRVLSPMFELGLPAMIVAHVTFQVAFVALVVRSRLASIGPHIEEAARDLYADTPGLLRRVMIPLLMPGIVAGAMLAFTLSLDDFVISFFTAGPESQTLPILIYGSLRRGLSPEIHALSTLIFLVTVLLVLGLERMTWLAKESK
ncbi:MAG TPA: ABC transporter permease [Phycisphaerae bacterium]|nr:ABC transporter permease [Phycisphaerae bacterium]HOJ75924.1 ABC transporter permease [Phycisphaerae bacterium]HOM52300.1 ABC transporter permease [Phycisphaerae bacterium]HON65576.1 ABC transporter permease [Phycisphaerae bacterium]HOQ84624.1 ABC transporter permease [Phycisphaerae bacterium]